MSLKAFHVFFISMAALMCFGIGAARAAAYGDGAGIGALVQAGAAFAGGAGLVGYGVRFFQKFWRLGGAS